MKENKMDISDIILDNYANYSYSILEDRALIRDRDGLKPVGRRILWTMYTMGLSSKKSHRKVSSIVGEVMGNFHPHGDVPISQALVRLGQEWTMMVPLVHPQGNFGSPDGDSCAAARYIEARLSEAGELLLEDTDKISNFAPNYDDRLTEPTFLAGSFPNVLINGDQGVAVGLSSKTPSHNPTEVAELVKFLTKNPNAKISSIFEIIQGPDFPTGGSIVDEGGIEEYFLTGKGTFSIRAVGSIKQVNSRHHIIVTQLPYQIGPSQIATEIAKLVESGSIDGVSDVKDYSDNEKGMYLIIETKPGVDPSSLIKILYDKTSLKINFSVNMNILNDDNKPIQIGFIDLTLKYIEYRREMIVRKLNYILENHKNRLHILNIYMSSITHMDKLIKIIKEEDNMGTLKTKISNLLKITEDDASIILDMQLRKLSKLEKNKIEEEISRLEKDILEIEQTISSKVKINNIICKEMDNIINICGCKRKTIIKNKP